jgi:hypothetical protein
MRLAQPFAEDLWLMDGDPVRFLGVPVETRMVIIRQKNGRLCLHSPVQPTPSRLLAIQELGEVAHLVAPNRLHAWRLLEWIPLFPQAKVWASPRTKERGLQAQTLGDAPPPDWTEDFDQVLVQGHRFIDEIVFLHRSSHTLLLTDLVQAHDPAKDSAVWRTLKRWAGLAPPGKVPPDLRWSFRDKAATRASIQRILAWEFDRYVIAHGLCLTSGAKAHFQECFRWLWR